MYSLMTFDFDVLTEERCCHRGGWIKPRKFSVEPKTGRKA